jgi:hypothetical protein
MYWQLAIVELVECSKVSWPRPRTIVNDAETGEQAGRWRAGINPNCTGADGDGSARNRAGVSGRYIWRQGGIDLSLVVCKERRLSRESLPS